VYRGLPHEQDLLDRTVLQEELHELLLPYGLNTKAIDRYVVTQQRQAVAVADPVALVRHFELLLVSVPMRCCAFRSWIWRGK